MIETLRGKILAIASVALLGMLVLGGVAIHAAQSGAERLEVVYRQAVAPLALVQAMERDVKEVRFRMAGVSLHHLPTMGSSVHLKAVMASLPIQWQEFKALVQEQTLDDDGKARMEKLAAGMERLQGMLAQVLAAYEADNLEALRDLLENQWPRVHGQVVKPLEQFVPVYEAQAKVAFESALLSSRQLVWLVIGLSSAALFIVGATYWVLQRRISQQFERAKDTVSAISRYDLSQTISVVGNDEISHLLHLLEQMQTKLRETVRHVREASDRVSAVSGEIAQGNQNLSNRTEQAASSLEQTAASMEELNSTVHNSADAASQVNELAARASEIAVRGGHVVGQVVMTMEEINQGSRKISDIIGVIDGIAFQTNILALNAAVEAARAGEQGRGFAVVATEVRNLAQRSAVAAREIKDLIGTSVEHVEQGTHLVDEAGQTMGEIVSSIQRVTDMVSEISGAASQESDGIGQINAAVAHLDQMTQQNASLVEESAARVINLQEEARHLAETVAVFRIDSRGEQVAARA